MNKRTLHLALGIILIAAIFLLIANRFVFNIVDDAYTTFRIGYHLNKYGTFDYNLGQHVLVTTSPLWASITSLAFYVTNHDHVPVLMNCLSLFLIFYTSLAVLLADRNAPLLKRLFIALGIITATALYRVTGMETALFIALITTSSILYFNGQLLVSGLILGLGIYARGDALIMIPIMLLISILDRKNGISQRIVRFITGLALTISTFGTFVFIKTGAFLPSTLETKIITGRLRLFGPNYWDNIRSAKGTVLFSENTIFNAFAATVALIVMLLIVRDIRKRQADNFDRMVLSIILFGTLQTIIYSSLQVGGNYVWYYLPLVISLTWALMFLFVRLISNRSLTKRVLGIILITSIFVFSTKNLPEVWTGQLGQMYKDCAQFITNRDKTAQIGLGEVGVIGYYLKDQEIVDYWGVASPAVIKLYGDAGRYDLGYFFANYQPTYLVGWAGSRPGLYQHNYEYDVVNRLTTPNNKYTLIVWQRAQ